MPPKIQPCDDPILAAKRAKYRENQKRNYQPKAHIESEKTNFLYKCPLCNFNAQRLEQFTSHDLKMMQRFYSGNASIRVEEIPITQEYKDAVKIALQEILDSLD